LAVVVDAHDPDTTLPERGHEGRREVGGVVVDDEDIEVLLFGHA
jgi:hypothetical protein